MDYHNTANNKLAKPETTMFFYKYPPINTHEYLQQ